MPETVQPSAHSLPFVSHVSSSPLKVLTITQRQHFRNDQYCLCCHPVGGLAPKSPLEGLKEGEGHRLGQGETVNCEVAATTAVSHPGGGLPLGGPWPLYPAEASALHINWALEVGCPQEGSTTLGKSCLWLKRHRGRGLGVKSARMEKHRGGKRA